MWKGEIKIPCYLITKEELIILCEILLEQNYLFYDDNLYIYINIYTGCVTTLGHNCRRWFPRPLWWKNSYKHVSDFGRLRSYDRFLIPVHALVWTASNSWRVTIFGQLQTGRSRYLDSFWYLRRAGKGGVGWSCYVLPARFTTERCGRWWHFRKSALSTDKFKLKVISRS